MSARTLLSDSVLTAGLTSGSSTSWYSSIPSSTFARETRSGSMSTSGPSSGSNRSAGTTSTIAPSRAPAALRSEAASSNSGMAESGASPEATLRTVSRYCSDAAAIAAPRARRSLSSPGASVIDAPPSFKRPAKSDLVRVLQVSPDRQPGGQAGDGQPHRAEHAHEVGRSGLALDVRVGGDDDLGDRTVGQAGHQLPDAQVVRADAVDRVDGPAEHVVAAAVLAGAFDRDDVLGLLDHAQQGRIAARVAADAALRLLGDVAAGLTEPHPRLDLGQGGGQPLHLVGVGAEDVESDPLSTLRADAGKLAQLIDQLLDDAVVGVHRSPPSPDSRISSITVPPSSRATKGAPESPVDSMSGSLGSRSKSGSGSGATSGDAAVAPWLSEARRASRADAIACSRGEVSPGAGGGSGAGAGSGSGACVVSGT